MVDSKIQNHHATCMRELTHGTQKNKKRKITAHPINKILAEDYFSGSGYLLVQSGYFDVRDREV